MTILRITALVALLALFCSAPISYAAPSCCDPNSSPGIAGNSFLPRPLAGQYAPVAPAQPGNVNPGFKQLPVVSGAVKPNSPQQLGCCAAAGPLPQAYTGSGASCCSGSRPGTVQAGAYPAQAQMAPRGCGGGCCGSGTTPTVVPGSQTARPIGQFVGAPTRGATATPAVNQGFYMQGARSYSGQGFDRPGYFGQGNPVVNTLY